MCAFYILFNKMCYKKAQYTFKKSAFSTLNVQRSVVFSVGVVLYSH